MAQREVLQIEIDSNGMVTGSRTGVRSLDDLKKSAGGLDGILGRLGGSIKGWAGGILTATAIVGGLGIAVSGLTRFVSDSVSSAASAQRAYAQLEAGVRSTGGAAGFTASELAGMASELQNITTFSDEAISEVQRILLTFKEVRGDQFRGATEAALDLATVMGGDLKSAALQLGKALQDPTQGMTVLRRSGVSFSDAQIDVIKALQDAGKMAEAQTIILAELNSQFGGSALADLNTYQGATQRLANLWDDAKEKIGGGVLPVLSDLSTRLSQLIVDNGELVTRVGESVKWLVQMGVATAALSAKVIAFGADLAGRVLSNLAAFERGVAALYDAVGADGLAAKLREAADIAVTTGLNMLNARDGAAALATTFDDVLAASDGVTTGASAASGALAGLGDSAGLAAAQSKEVATQLRAIEDRLDPVGAATRAYEDDLKFLNEQLRSKDPEKYAGLVKLLEQELIDARAAAVGLKANLSFDELPVSSIADRLAALRDPNEGQTIQVPYEIKGDGGAAEIAKIQENFEDASAEASAQFSADVLHGGISAVTATLAEFARGGEVTAEDFGRMLLDILLQSVERWLQAQLAAIAQAAAASKAIGGSTGAAGGGGGGWMSSLFGGGGGGSSAMAGAVGALVVVGVVAGIAAWARHERSEERKKQYDTTVNFTFGPGASPAEVQGRLRQTGQAIADGLSGLISELEGATGSFLAGAIEAQIKIRHDKGAFQAIVAGELIGTFQSAEHAIIAAAKKLFASENLSRSLDPIVERMIQNFNPALGAEKLIESVSAVQSLIDELSGLSEVELAIRNLPSQAAALSAELQGMGVSLQDAGRLTAQWTAQQLQSIRNQITGHQMTEAEQRAERERQALFFNAQLALMKAETQMKRDKVAADLAALMAQVQIARADTELSNAHIHAQRDYLNVRHDFLFAQRDIYNAELGIMEDFSFAQIEILNAQLVALDAALASLNQVNPINLGEIQIGNIGNVGGVGGDLGGETDAEREARERAEDLKNLWQQITSTMQGLSGWQGQLAELNARTAEQVELAHGDAAAILALQEAYLAQRRALADQALDSLGSPVEGFRDRLRELQNTLKFLQGEVEAGILSHEEYALVIGEVARQTEGQFASLAASLAEQMGLEEEAAQFRETAARAEFAFKVAELQFLYNAYIALGNINAEILEQMTAFLDLVADPANWPDFAAQNAPTPAGGGASAGGPDPRDEALAQLTRALDRLRNALDRYNDFLADSEVSALSGGTLGQRTNAAMQQYLETLALAQAGDIQAIEDLPGLAQQYLELAAQYLDPSSAQYQAILALVRGQMEGVGTTIEDVLNSAPSSALGDDGVLNTIAQVLAAIEAYSAMTAADVTGGGLGGGTGTGAGAGGTGTIPGSPGTLPGGPTIGGGPGNPGGGPILTPWGTGSFANVIPFPLSPAASYGQELSKFSSGNALRVVAETPNLDRVLEGAMDVLRFEIRSELRALRQSVGESGERVAQSFNDRRAPAPRSTRLMAGAR